MLTLSEQNLDRAYNNRAFMPDHARHFLQSAQAYIGARNAHPCDTLSAEEAKALIYARETGVVDNMACRDFSELDTLQASILLRRLRDRGLLQKQGAGSRTHYTLANPVEATHRHPQQGDLLLENAALLHKGGNQLPEGGKRDLPPLPPELAARLPTGTQRMGQIALRQLIRDLCGWQPLRGEELATLLGRDRKYLRNKHLSAMVATGELEFQFPESPNHALQAYKLRL
jgi:ATP-dependent DNA helicase RecG